MSHNPTGLHGLLQGKLYFIYFVCILFNDSLQMLHRLQLKKTVNNHFKKM
jgi:hypothetical protein